MNKPKKEKLNAELWDRMHYLFRDFNDRMVHVELRYNYRIDIEALKTVLISFFEKAPVFHSSFVDNHIKPKWEINKYKIDEVLTVSQPENLDEAINEFLTQYIPPENEIQMKVAVFFHDEGSVLCIVENHMCMDGGDFKYFLKSLCQNYNDYVERKISPVNLKTGTRSYDAVYGDFTYVEKRMAKNLYKNVCSKDDHRFPFTPNDITDKAFIAKKKIDSDTFLKIKEIGKKHGATVNDVLVAAYFHCLYDLASFGDDESVTISCAIDLRRHIKDNSESGLTNQTAFMQCGIQRRGKDFFETLEYVVQSSKRYKTDKFMGLYGLPLLNLGYSLFPSAISEKIIKAGYSNPLLAMSNIGILDSKGLALEGNEPVDGFMTGAVKYKPYVLLSVTSLRNELTLSLCERGNAEDKKIADRFLEMISELLLSL